MHVCICLDLETLLESIRFIVRLRWHPEHADNIGILGETRAIENLMFLHKFEVWEEGRISLCPGPFETVKVLLSSLLKASYKHHLHVPSLNKTPHGKECKKAGPRTEVKVKDYD